MKRLALILVPILLAGCAGLSFQAMAPVHEMRFRMIVLRSLPSLNSRMHVATLADSKGKPVAILDFDGGLSESARLCNDVLALLRKEDFSADFSEINIKCGHFTAGADDIKMKLYDPDSTGHYADAGTLQGVGIARNDRTYYSMTIGVEELGTGGSPRVIIKDGKYTATGKDT